MTNARARWPSIFLPSYRGTTAFPPGKVRVHDGDRVGRILNFFPAESLRGQDTGGATAHPIVRSCDHGHGGFGVPGVPKLAASPNGWVAGQRLLLLSMTRAWPS